VSAKLQNKLVELLTAADKILFYCCLLILFYC